MNKKDNGKETEINSEITDSANQNENDSSLESLINQEQSIARQNLLEKLGREPSQEEIDKWLSAQTEGY